MYFDLKGSFVILTEYNWSHCLCTVYSAYTKCRSLTLHGVQVLRLLLTLHTDPLALSLKIIKN